LPLETTSLTQAQLDWIEADILAARAAGAEWAIPLMHASPYSDGSNHPNALAARDQLAPLFHCGHVWNLMKVEYSRNGLDKRLNASSNDQGRRIDGAHATGVENGVMIPLRR
jgi:hypothetical protein